MADKSSSPSRQASHKRGPARTAANKIKKMARHYRAVAKKADKAFSLNWPGSRAESTPLQRAKAGTLEAPKFPRVPAPRPVERMVMGAGSVKPQPHPLHIITCNGVLIEISPRSQDAANAKAGIFPRLGYRHEILHADGRRVLVEKRNAN